MTNIKIKPDGCQQMRVSGRLPILDAETDKEIGEISYGFTGREKIVSFFNVIDLRPDAAKFEQVVNLHTIPTYNGAKAVAEYYFSLPLITKEESKFTALNP